MMVEFLCEPCGIRWESLEERPAPVRVLHVACGKEAERVISAPKPVVASAKPTPVTRGRYEERPGPRAVDTRSLAEGQTRAEWKKQRRQVWRDQRHAQVKRELS